MEYQRNFITNQLGERFHELLDETKHLVGIIGRLEARVVSLEKEVSRLKNNKGQKSRKDSKKKSKNPIPQTVSIKEYLGLKPRVSKKEKKTAKVVSKPKPVAKPPAEEKKNKILKSKEEGSGKRNNYRSVQRQHRRHLTRFLTEEPLKKGGEKIFLHPNSASKLLKSDHDLNSSGDFEQQAQNWRKEFSRLYVQYRSALRRLVVSRKTKIAPKDDLMKISFEEKVTKLIAKSLDELGEWVSGDSWNDIIISNAWEVGTREPILKKDSSLQFTDIYAVEDSQMWPYPEHVVTGQMTTVEKAHDYYVDEPVRDWSQVQGKSD